MATMPAALATGLKRIRSDEIPIPEPSVGQGSGQDEAGVHLRQRSTHCVHGLECFTSSPCPTAIRDTRA